MAIEYSLAALALKTKLHNLCRSLSNINGIRIYHFIKTANIIQKSCKQFIWSCICKRSKTAKIKI